MQLKALKKKWPKAKIRKEFIDNNNRYPETLKKDVKACWEKGFVQKEIASRLQLDPSYISKWTKNKKVKKAKKKVSKKKVSKKKKVEAEATAVITESYWDKLENDKVKLINLEIEMRMVSERLDEVKLVQYLEEVAERLIFEGDTRDLGYAISVVGEMIRLLNLYLKNPNTKTYEKVMKKLI